MYDFIVTIFERFLGEPRKSVTSDGQVSFDCPKCAEIKGIPEGDGKGNLEINISKGIYHCWSCGQTHYTKGRIPKLIRRYGNQALLKEYLLLKPDDDYVADKTKGIDDLALPDTFKFLSEANEYDDKYKQAMFYLKSRNIDAKTIEKYNIGFTSKGKHHSRIIIPSYGVDDDLNYFIARSFFRWNKPKYLNPKNDKSEIIFNEKLINWDSTIYLVEGVFDHIVTPNSIPLLGKHLHDNLFYSLLKKANSQIIIVLDGDAYMDAIEIYKKLNTSRLRGKVKVVQLNPRYDLSDINRKFGKKGVIKVLGDSKMIPETML